MPLKSPIQVTLFLWATDVMSYSNIRPPLSKPYLCFLLFYNSFLRPHFHVFYTICNFPRIPTFQVPHMKMSTVPGPCPRSSRCPLTTTCPSLPPATPHGQNWIYPHIHFPTCSWRREQTRSLCHYGGGFAVWPGQPQRPFAEQSRGTGHRVGSPCPEPLLSFP